MTFKRTYEENRLLQLLAEDSHYAFTQVFDHYKDRIYDLSYRILKSPLMAEEIVQDVFMKIWMKRAELHGIDNFGGFLYMTARNLIFDRLKQISYETNLKKNLSSKDQLLNNTDHRVQHQQYIKILNDAINLLPPQQKQVYLLSRESGFSHEEIGQILHISKLTVKKHLVVAMKFIRKYCTIQMKK